MFNKTYDKKLRNNSSKKLYKTISLSFLSIFPFFYSQNKVPKESLGLI